MTVDENQHSQKEARLDEEVFRTEIKQLQKVIQSKILKLAKPKRYIKCALLVNCASFTTSASLPQCLRNRLDHVLFAYQTSVTP